MQPGENGKAIKDEPVSKKAKVKKEANEGHELGNGQLGHGAGGKAGFGIYCDDGEEAGNGYAGEAIFA